MVSRSVLIVPVDGSDCALRAVAYACRRFKLGGFQALLALNVQPPIPSGRIVTKQMVRDHQAEQAERALAPARALAARMGLTLRTSFAISAPAAAIVATAKKARGDEILMGTRGRGRWKSLIVGSTASAVIQLAAVPVTLVK
jgi:nucleotide-binding universal stress UspA family protein